MSLIFPTLTLGLSVILLNVLLGVEAQLELSGPKFTVGNKQYHIESEDDSKNFYQAAYECTKLGMTLASIESKTEYRRLFSVLRNSDNLEKEYWLGGTSMGNDEILYWLTTGKNIQYWPDNNKITAADQCLMTTASKFKYESADCTVAKYYICEKSVEPYCGLLGRCKRN